MKTAMKIYLAHPISGLSYDEIMTYYRDTAQQLGNAFDILCPMLGKTYLRNETKVVPSGYVYPVSTDHAIVGRDSWMVQSADVVYINLERSKSVSIGCCMELAWAKLLNKHVIVVMEKDNLHRHAFVLDCAHIVFETHLEAMAYLLELGHGYAGR